MKLGFGSSVEKNGVPRIERIVPSAAIPGGEITVYGSGFTSRPGARRRSRAGGLTRPYNALARGTPWASCSGRIGIGNRYSRSQTLGVGAAFLRNRAFD